jgi:hypothetical protein
MVQAVKVAQSGELKGVDAISLNLNSVLVSAPVQLASRKRVEGRNRPHGQRGPRRGRLCAARRMADIHEQRRPS